MMSWKRAAACLVLLAVPCTPAAAQDAVEQGRAIVEEKCARCHATGVDGESTLAAAPPFRTLGERYPLDSLEEALAEGIVTAHPDMPSAAFEPDEVAAILAYLGSIQEQQ